MDSELLRRACEAAGLEISFYTSRPVFFEARKGAFQFDSDNPALPAYVASLLVAKVREMEDYGRAFSQALDGIVDPESYHVTAPDERRIRAAMEVLEDE